MKTTAHLLVIRFSALGDVAMTVPVIRNLLHQYPDVQVTMLSDPFMEPMFRDIPRLQFIGADTRKDFRGLAGLFRLSRRVARAGKYTAIADLHNVLRTKILRAFFPFKRKAAIDKGRAEKKELTRPNDKKLRQLKTSFERYADVFRDLGFNIVLDTQQGFSPAFRSNDTPNKKIGIAPFARHKAKMLSLDITEELVWALSKNNGFDIYLFGSKQEAPLLREWADKYRNIRVVAGTVTFDEELKIISGLDAMMSMDSANMHLASLYGVPVVSVWGGTHPYLGFYGWGQDPQNAVQTDLPCRPSSVFGNKACPVHGEAGCMQEITSLMIYERLMSAIKTSQR